MKILKTRSLKTEIRANEENGERWVIGKIPYNSKSENLSWDKDRPIYEVITPTAFKKTLADKARVLAYYSHDTGKVLGSTKNDTLILENTEAELIARCKIPNTSWGNDAWEIITRGDVPTMSFGFIPFDIETKGDTDYLRSVKLEEVSFCVANPAYPETNSIGEKRSLEDDTNGVIEKIKGEIKDKDMELLKTLRDSLNEIIEPVVNGVVPQQNNTAVQNQTQEEKEAEENLIKELEAEIEIELGD